MHTSKVYVQLYAICSTPIQKSNLNLLKQMLRVKMLAKMNQVFIFFFTGNSRLWLEKITLRFTIVFSFYVNTVRLIMVNCITLFFLSTKPQQFYFFNFITHLHENFLWTTFKKIIWRLLKWGNTDFEWINCQKQTKNVIGTKSGLC